MNSHEINFMNPHKTLIFFFIIIITIIISCNNTENNNPINLETKKLPKFYNGDDFLKLYNELDKESNKLESYRKYEIPEKYNDRLASYIKATNNSNKLYLFMPRFRLSDNTMFSFMLGKYDPYKQVMNYSIFRAA
jgi:hypothetical protein